MMHRIKDDIFSSIEKYFELKIMDERQIELGYKNLKWEIHASGKTLFVKQYNRDRYPEHLISGLEFSLQTQAKLSNLNLPVPKPYSFNDQYIIRSSKGERFMVTEKCTGKNLAPGTLNEMQMYHLGKTVGEMHTMFDVFLPDSKELHWDIRSKEDMIADWNMRWREAAEAGCKETLSYLKDQLFVLNQSETDQFSACEIGWSHWDLFVDNILFDGNKISAILDFDRLNIVYRDFDIARPILSGCISNKTLNVKAALAFVNGFREYQPLSIARVVRALKLNWWREAEWLSVPKPERSAVLTRFNVENRWVAAHWSQLEEILSGK